MSKRLLFTVPLCWFLWPSTSVVGQKLKTSPFQQVEVPKSVLVRLNQVATKEDKHSAAENPMYVTNLLAKQDIAYRDGIYYFRVMSPHSLGRLFIVSKGNAAVFTSTDTGLIQEYADFLAKNELPEKTRIAYLRAIAMHLEQQYRSEHE